MSARPGSTLPGTLEPLRSQTPIRLTWKRRIVIGCALSLLLTVLPYACFSVLTVRKRWDMASPLLKEICERRMLFGLVKPTLQPRIHAEQYLDKVTRISLPLNCCSNCWSQLPELQDLSDHANDDGEPVPL